MQILVLFTCHNRKDTTIACVESLISDSHQKFDFIVVDDKSTDGTAGALKAYRNIRVISGNGNLFYSGGMRRAIAAAKKSDLEKYDYILLVNDDVLFFENAITKLIGYLEGEEAVMAGATCDEEGKLSYGGVIKTHPFKPKFQSVLSKNSKIYCDTFCANCVLIPIQIFKKTENIDPIYHHAMGDFDYGFAIRRAGYQIIASNFFVGKCNDNPKSGSWLDTSLSRKERLKKKESPKGLPWREYFHFLLKNHGWPAAVLYSISPYLRIMAGR